MLANKSMDEQCALMDAMKDRKMFPETDVALDYTNYRLLSITDYISVVRYEIDQFMINKFWQCVSENLSADISAEILHWLLWHFEGASTCVLRRWISNNHSFSNVSLQIKQFIL